MAHPPHSPATPNAAAHIRVSGISASYGSHRVLTDISFSVTAGDPTGLIGENGSGKSTLLRIMAGLRAPDAGEVRAVGLGDPLRVGLLHQEPPFAPHDTVAQAVESAVRTVRDAASVVDRAADALARAPEDEGAAAAYAAALDTAERIGAWEVDTRIDVTLDGLGLGGVDRDRSTYALSGGQRSRLSLAWLLLSTPDVLLLDEPTNHLDDAATEFLRATLRSWHGPAWAPSRTSRSAGHPGSCASRDSPRVCPDRRPHCTARVRY
ncbi:ATP-binding cassette domain-containing protein [Kocuria sp. CPCC 204721]|uniref:ATP-binding cassette domain-containing protein n=1 Tax=Kocuria sp. CPCC 204721 TaxID=3073548 RepID=UPI0034D653CD